MSSMPALPSDILFEIAKRCGWKEVYALRRVSQACFEVTKAKEIWIGLVKDIIAADPSSPPVHHLELTIDMYSSEELEEICGRWLKMRHSWDLKANVLALQSPKSVPWIGTRDDRAGLNRTCYIVPGGRWFLRFYKNGSATYQDLSKPVLEHSLPLIPALHTQQASYGNESVFDPFIVAGASTLTFLTGTCVTVGSVHSHAYQINIYKVSLRSADGALSSELSAEQLVSFRVVCHRVVASAQDLQDDRLLLRLQSNSTDKQAAAVVFWREVQNETRAAEMRLVPTEDETYLFMNLLPYNRLLLNNGMSSRMVDYTNAGVHHIVRPSNVDTNSSPGHLLASFLMSFRRDTPISNMIYELTTGHAGRPYIFRDASGTSSSDRVVVRQVTIISDEHRAIFTVMGHEFAYRYSSTTPLYSTSINFGEHQGHLNRYMAVLGYCHAILPPIIAPTESTTADIHLALTLEWPQMSETGDLLTEFVMDVRPVKPLVAYSSLPANEWGIVRAMDEGTGRVFWLSGDDNQGYRALVSELA